MLGAGRWALVAGRWALAAARGPRTAAGGPWALGLGPAGRKFGPEGAGLGPPYLTVEIVSCVNSAGVCLGAPDSIGVASIFLSPICPGDDFFVKKSLQLLQIFDV